MRFLLSFSLILVAICVSVLADSPPYQTRYFDQTLDHYNWRTSPQTWKQRYLMNDDYYQTGGPIIFYCGNEADVTAFWENSGLVFEMAEQFKAFVIFAEHRYYGVSMPFGDASFQPQNIGYLSSEQALADYAVMITDLKLQLGLSKSKVMTVGGSYGGMLSAWMRIKYPNIVDAALSCSGPIALFPGLVDQYAFFSVVTQDFGSTPHGAQCVNTIRSALQHINTLAQSASGLASLTTAFELCAPLKNYQDAQGLQFFINNAYVNLAMLDYPYETNFLQKLAANPVNVSCDALLSTKEQFERYGPPHVDPVLASLAASLKVWYNSSGDVSCYNLSTAVPCADPSGCGGAIAWDYQACSEMVFPVGANDVTDFFPAYAWNYTWLVDYCQKSYGITPRPNWAVTNYGGRNLAASSNIVFSNGARDPWRVGGITESISDSLVAIVIAEAAHHLDLRGSHTGDPQSVIDARAQETALMRKWLGIAV